MNPQTAAQDGTFSIPEHKLVTAPPPYARSTPTALAPPEECRAVGSILSLVGDKWGVMIIVTLGGGAMRFSEIKRAIGGISQRMLTLTLRGLEREGLVTRTQFETIPPRVDYALTELGVSLLRVVRPLGAWARAHIKQITVARAAFESRSST